MCKNLKRDGNIHILNEINTKRHTSVRNNQPNNTTEAQTMLEMPKEE
jgi:ribosomal protein L36